MEQYDQIYARICAYVDLVREAYKGHWLKSKHPSIVLGSDTITLRWNDFSCGDNTEEEFDATLQEVFCDDPAACIRERIEMEAHAEADRQAAQTAQYNARRLADAQRVIAEFEGKQ